MPWIPELFSSPVLERYLSRARGARAAIPYFQGLLTGETDALVRSFAGEPEIHHPWRGRIRGRSAFEAYVANTNAWLTESRAVIEDVDRVVTPLRGVEEALLRLEEGRIEIPVAIVADRDVEARILELRVYYSGWPLIGRHAVRSPLLQPNPDLAEPDVVGEYQRALAAGDASAAVAAFEPDGYVREPSGARYLHRGRDELHALYESFFSGGGGIPLEHCAVTDDGRACALEYNVVRWGRTSLQPQAGVAVYVRGESGRLAAARIYDDADPPPG
jgi:hypothetical protein